MWHCDYYNFISWKWGLHFFSKQKKGIRAVIAGFINYYFWDGIRPGHTKSAFSEYRILTIQNIIALNAFSIIEKVRTLLPSSVVSIINTSSPVPGPTYEDQVNNGYVFTIYMYIVILFFKTNALFLARNIRNYL